MAKTVGFLGLGIMGKGMAANLVKAGFKVNVWNRSTSKVDEFCKEHSSASACATPKQVLEESEVTFACMATVDAAKSVVFGENGVLTGCAGGKAYVDCSTVSAECSKLISDAVEKAGGKFLEAPVSGSKGPAADGTLIFLCGGDKSIFDSCTAELDAMGKQSHFLGECGQGARMKLVVNMIMGTMLNSLAEGIALAEASELDTSALLNVLDNGAMKNPMFGMKGPCMQKRTYPTNFPLKHAQKDMRLAIALGDDKHVSLPGAAAANEVYKRAMEVGCGDDDFCAVFESVKRQKK